MKITDTQSLKRNLSYDPASHSLLYEASTKATPSSVPWEIYLFSLNTKIETSTHTEAIRSGIAAGGAGLFVVSSSTLDYVSLPEEVHTRILHDIHPASTLVAKDGLHIITFDSISHTINTYTMKSPGNVTFTTASKKVDIEPLSLGYQEGNIYSVFVDKTVPASMFQVLNLSTGVLSSLAVPRNATITSVTYE